MLASERTVLSVVLLALAAIILLEFVSLFIILLRRTGVLPRKKRRGVVRVASICLHSLTAVLVLCALYAYFIEPYWIEVVNVDVPTAKLARAELTVVHISDLHCDAEEHNEEDVVRIVNEMKPDIIVFTGDAANESEGLATFRRTLAKMNARLGKFAVRGNFDADASEDELVAGTGFRLLDHDTVVVIDGGESFCVAGISCTRHNEIGRVLGRVPPGMFCIFLHHYPHVVEDLPRGVVDLSLCGHIHGGQIALPFYGAIITLSKTGKKYEKGAYEVNGTLLYVSRGLGMEGGATPRMRFCARPEITVFRVRPSK